MSAKHLITPLILMFYAAVPFATGMLVSKSDRPADMIVRDVAIASIPMVLLAALTWRLVWPRWKLITKLILHPCIYAVLAAYIGSWTIVVAWLHQGVFGLGGHIWFSRKHGFKWYAVEDPDRYVALSKEMVSGLSKTTSAQ
jgi:hypothetical protein